MRKDLIICVLNYHYFSENLLDLRASETILFCMDQRTAKEVSMLNTSESTYKMLVSYFLEIEFVKISSCGVSKLLHFVSYKESE